MKLATTLGAVALLAASLVTHAGEAPTYGKHLSTPAAVAKSRPGSFDVYIDPPTGFAFVHTPAGWKFTRKVEEQRLPAPRSAPVANARAS